MTTPKDQELEEWKRSIAEIEQEGFQSSFYSNFSFEDVQAMVGEIERAQFERERMGKLLDEVISTIKRRMNSDDSCEMPFDEDLGELLQKLREMRG